MATCSEALIDFCVCFEEFAAVSGFYGIRFDEVRINCIKNDDVVVTAVGRDREATGLVGEQLSINFDGGHVDHVCFVVVWCLWVLSHMIRRSGRRVGHLFGGSDVGFALVHVALFARG